MFLAVSCASFAQQQHQITSPDGKIVALLQFDGDDILISAKYENQPILRPSPINLELADGTIPQSANSRKPVEHRVTGTISSPVPEKRSVIEDNYNILTIKFSNPYTLTIRVYNDGFAYRWSTQFKDTITVKQERADFEIPPFAMIYYPQVKPREDADQYHTAFEENYTRKIIDSIPASTLCFTPLLAGFGTGPKMLITESDLEDYPGMFLRGGEGKLKAEFAAFPIEFKVVGAEFPQAVVTGRAAFIAHTKGNRDFPWRVFVVAREDRELPSNDLVYRLAQRSRVDDVSWIHPGKGTDEWTIGINLFNVPFKTGVNTATYKYYIDFAKKFGFERIMMDAGWSDPKDLFAINPDINMDEIAAYAKAQGIGLSMWTLAMTLDRQLEQALDQFNKWGVSFIMTDFMDRDDQKMVNFYYRVAEACARHKIMLMFHGAFKPAGFTRTFPNAMTREAVLGSEYNIWSDRATPDHNLLLPFIRMVSGPMDYEPGILDNATPKTFRPISDKVMTIGTRCQQLAMFVVYDSPMQFFSGNPSQGMMEPEFMKLLGSIPTTWDETIIPDARLGEYIVTVRKKGKDWFVGAMTNSQTRSLELKLDFLGEGNFEAEICEDGINADRYPSDYLIRHLSLTKTDNIKIKMAPGGGWMMRLTRK